MSSEEGSLLAPPKCPMVTGACVDAVLARSQDTGLEHCLWGSPSPSLNLGFLTLCSFCPRVPSPPPLPQEGGYSLAVCGQLQVIRPHFEEVQQVWAAGDLHGQSHEAVEVLSECALAALGGTLPIEPPGCWVGETRDP